MQCAVVFYLAQYCKVWQVIAAVGIAAFAALLYYPCYVVCFGAVSLMCPTVASFGQEVTVVLQGVVAAVKQLLAVVLNENHPCLCLDAYTCE